MRLRFEEFDLDTEARTLRREGRVLPLEPRAFDLLAHLARNPDRIVSKSELLRVVWPGVRVSLDSVDQAIRSIRRALGDDARAPRFLRTAARRGVQFVATLASRPAADRYAGRAELLAALRVLLEDAASGRGSVALLCGPPGIGKTRTASELLGWATARGFLAAQAVCTATSTEACRPWHDLAEQLAPRTESGAPAGDRSTQLAALRRALTRSDAPALLLVDDLHEADESSVTFLDTLANFVPRHPLLVVTTARGADSWVSASAAQAFARLALRARVTRFELGPLDTAAVGELVEARAGTRPSAAHCADLADRTGGNPLWIHQLLGAGLAAELKRGTAHADADASFGQAIGRSMRQAILVRLTELDPETTRALQAAAVVGREFDSAEVAAIAGLPLERVHASLGVAHAAGFVVGASEAALPRRFAHELFREAVLERIERGRRTALHLAAARVLEQKVPGSAALRAAVAHQLLAAGAAGEPARAVALALAAGREAALSHAHDRAESLLASAADLLDAADASDAVRCDVWLALALAREQRNSFDRSGAADRSLELSRRLGTPEPFARAALARIGPMDRVRLPDPATVALLEEALARLGPEAAALHARLLGRLEAETRYLPDPARSESLRRLALAEARASGDLETELRLFDLPFGGFWEGTPGDERLAIVMRAIAYAEASGNRELGLTARLLWVQELASRGELGRVRLELDRADAEAVELDDGAARYRVRVSRAMCANAQGDFDAAERFATEARAEADRVGFPGETLARVHRLVSTIGRGGARDAVEPMRVVRRLDPGPGVGALLIHTLAVAGEHTACAEELRAFARDALPTLGRYPSAVANAFVLACAAVVADVPEVVAPLETLLAPERERVATRGLMAYHGPVALALASCAALRGDAGAAAALLRYAETLARRAHAGAWLSDVERLRPALESRR